MIILFDVLLYFVLLICSVGAVFCIYLLYRNHQVYRYRSLILERVSTAAAVDIAHNLEWLWRYEQFNSISYADMMAKPFKPLDDFYLDKSFLMYTRVSLSE